MSWSAFVSFRFQDEVSSYSPIKTQDFAENEDQHHSHEYARLLHVGADALVADDADAVAGCEARKTDG